ncbi:SAM-dependent methyltransferase [Salinispora tropica]|uniref:SAM-dependent methyltransferase n=1 Tax=Salinispora tropica TaxID=168695 RepID=UPI000364A80C|nr:class I SAM-dependent methyltransferase [Salinispora tropica]
MTDFDAFFNVDYWDQRYSETGQVWSGEPNPVLVAEVAPLAPGTALEVGCGEGADAIWLAGQGWQVTGVDFSAQALSRAAERVPASLAERLRWQRADIRDWQPDDGPRYDLVSTSFLHFSGALRRRVFATLATRVAPDGHLLIVGHHPSDLDTAMPRPPEPDLFYTADELAQALPARDWEVRTRAARPRDATTPDGTPVTIHDTVLTARRVQ